MNPVTHAPLPRPTHQAMARFLALNPRLHTPSPVLDCSLSPPFQALCDDAAAGAEALEALQHALRPWRGEESVLA